MNLPDGDRRISFFHQQKCMKLGLFGLGSRFNIMNPCSPPRRLRSCRALLECWTRLRNAYGFPHASHSWTQLAAKDWIPWWLEMGSGLTLFHREICSRYSKHKKNMNQMFRYRGEIETNWCCVPKKVYLWILFTKRTVAMMFKEFMTANL